MVNNKIKQKLYYFRNLNVL